jgi:hypothetical protein
VNCGARPPADAVLDVCCVRTDAVSGLRFDILALERFLSCESNQVSGNCERCSSLRGCLARWCRSSSWCLGAVANHGESHKHSSKTLEYAIRCLHALLNAVLFSVMINTPAASSGARGRRCGLRPASRVWVVAAKEVTSCTPKQPCCNILAPRHKHESIPDMTLANLGTCDDERAMTPPRKG